MERSSPPEHAWQGITYDTGFLDGHGDSRGQRYPDMPWEPKTAFTTLADYYGR